MTTTTRKPARKATAAKSAPATKTTARKTTPARKTAAKVPAQRTPQRKSLQSAVTGTLVKETLNCYVYALSDDNGVLKNNTVYILKSAVEGDEAPAGVTISLTY